MKAPYRYAPQGNKFIQMERGQPTGKTYSSEAAARQETLRLNDAWRAKGSLRRNPSVAETQDEHEARMASEFDALRMREAELLRLIETSQAEYQMAYYLLQKAKDKIRRENLRIAVENRKVLQPLQEQEKNMAVEERDSRARLNALYAELREVQKARSEMRRPFTGPF